MSFKRNSNDLRESPYVDLIERLYHAGIALRIFDPDVDGETLKNFNREFCQRLDHLIPLIQWDVSTTLEGCDGVVVCKDLLDASLIKQLHDTNVPVYDLGYFYESFITEVPEKNPRDLSDDSSGSGACEIMKDKNYFCPVRGECFVKRSEAKCIESMDSKF